MIRSFLPAVGVLLCFCPGYAAEMIVSERVIEAPVADVWMAWTTSDGLASWLAPHADTDLRLGGRMRTHYDPAGVLGDPATIENEILAFDPEHMLAIRVAKAPAEFPFREIVGSMWTVLYFTPVSDARTHVRVVGLGFAEDARSQQMRQFFERGNAYTLEQLSKHFERIGPESAAAH